MGHLVSWVMVTSWTGQCDCTISLLLLSVLILLRHDLLDNLLCCMFIYVFDYIRIFYYLEHNFVYF